MQATFRTVVDAPIDTVWQVVADHEGMGEWGPGLHATLLKRGADHRNGVGAVRKLTSTLPAPAIVEEITAFDPPHRLDYRATSGVPLRNYGGSVELRSAAGGTEIAYTISADRRLPGLDAALVQVLARALSALLVRQVKKVARVS